MNRAPTATKAPPMVTKATSTMNDDGFFMDLILCCISRCLLPPCEGDLTTTTAPSRRSPLQAIHASPNGVANRSGFLGVSGPRQCLDNSFPIHLDLLLICSLYCSSCLNHCAPNVPILDQRQ